MTTFRALAYYNHPVLWRRRFRLFFLEYPLETSIWMKATFVGCFLLLHPAAFKDTPAWAQLEAFGHWFPFGAPAFIGLLSVFAGLAHAFGMCTKSRLIRQTACVFSASLWGTVAYNLFSIDSSDPAAMVFVIGMIYSIYVFLLASMDYSTMRVTKREKDLIEEDRSKTVAFLKDPFNFNSVSK